MCACNPSIRTPFCGKLSCGWTCVKCGSGPSTAAGKCTCSPPTSYSKLGAEDKPLSENIGRYDGGKYLVTAAIWRTEAGRYDTFEIGIRNIKTGEFTLLQSDKYRHQSVQEVADAIATLLARDYTPEWCKEFLS